MSLHQYVEVFKKMFASILKKLFGSANERTVMKFKAKVKKINELEPRMKGMSDEELRAQTAIFRDRLAKGEALDDLLIEAFATVREASWRTLGMRHFDVQLIGGMILHQGMIAEMRTGEGKTLVSTLAAYLNALPGKGVHVVTVNDYLAKRDSEWMGRLHNFLGLSVGCIVNSLDDESRRQAYNSDITYATNNELGFDYLRDNMKFRLNDMVQRTFHYAIVDEVDSILIDEARTPLIISGPTEDSSELYVIANQIVHQFAAEDYEKEEKHNNVTLTDAGMEKTESLLKEAGLLKGNSLYDIHNIAFIHHINQALKAVTLFQKDRDYIVKDNRVIIIDEFTGRMMDGRRYSDGLHQAIEAKENVPIQTENQTLASITFQNFFRLYPKLAGMTGTAMTEASEFSDIYKLEVVELPTNKPCIRKDMDDEVYRTEAEKFKAIIDLIKECRDREQPVLIGTASIEKSEKFSAELSKHKIPHQVLNARYHEKEAHIITEAGKPGAITIATNMAGRGTDIQLGGNLEARLRASMNADMTPAQIQALEKKLSADIEQAAEKVKKAGGLFVVGTERHESRRIDNQLRGRSGRQGDPGASKFYLSLEDDLMRIFGSERLDGMLQKLGLEEGEAITHPWINKAIQRAQGKVEARNFDIRKHLLKYDDVMNDQRKVIYDQRRELMVAEDISDSIIEMREQVLEDLIERTIPAKAYADQWDIQGLHEECHRLFALDLPIQEWSKEEGIADEEIRNRIRQAAEAFITEKFQNHSPEIIRMIEKSLLLRMLDQNWKDHLLSLDHLRQGINLRAYAQRDPLNEYKREAFALFEYMLMRLRENVTSVLCHFTFDPHVQESDLEPEEPIILKESRSDPALGEDGSIEKMPVITSRKPAETIDPRDPSTWGRISRNDPCPCGSGKKYKQCHGLLS
jgi:preprotein translocase subunit SecA